MIVRELVTRLGFRVDNKKIHDWEQGTLRIKDSAEKAANSFRNMFAAFIGFSAIKSIARTADSMQSLEARIGMLPQTVGEAGDAFDLVGRKATDARQPVESYANLYIRLAGATKDYMDKQEDVLLVTDAISQALVIGGAAATEQASALLQLSQAFQKGKLDGDEFRAFMETLSTDFKTKLAEQLGTTTDQLFDLSKSGQLTAKKLAFAFKAMAPEITKQMLQMPMTIGQAMNIIGNKWGMFIARLNRKSGTVTSVANFLLAGFDKLERGLENIIEFFGGATQAIKVFGIVIAAALAPLIAGGLVAALGLLVNPMTLVIGALVLLGLVIEDVYQFMTGGESVIGDFVDWINSGTVGANVLKGVLIALGLVLGSLALAFTAAWLAAISPIMLIILAVMALYGTFLFFKEEVIQIMSDVWASITERFDYMINGLRDGWNKFKASLGFSATITPNVVAGAASSAGGTGAPMAGGNITINQELPPGTPQETAAAAAKATEMAAYAMSDNQAARQMGAYAQ